MLILLLLAAMLLIVFLVTSLIPGEWISILWVAIHVLATGVALYLKLGERKSLMALGGIAVSFGSGAYFWLNFFPKTRYGRRLISSTVVGEIGAERPELLNRIGTTLTQLRPSGAASIDGCRIDVITEGSFIEKDITVKVVATEGMRVVVRALSGHPSHSPETKTTHT